MVKRTGQPAFSGAPTVSIGLREVLDAAPDVIFCCDQKGRFQWVSAAIDSVAGVKASDLLGNSFTRLVPAPYRSHIARRYLRRARALHTDAHLDIARIQNTRGEEVWLAVRSKMSTSPDGELMFVGVARPMSAAEIALANGEMNARSRPAAETHGPARSWEGFQTVAFDQFPPPEDAPGEKPAPAAPEPLSASNVAPIAPLAPPLAAPAVLPPAESNTQVLAAIQTANEARAEAERRLAELRADHEDTLRRVTGLESERDQLRNEREILDAQMTEARGRRDEFERQLADASSRRDASESQLADARGSREASEAQLAETRSRLEAAERQLSETQRRYSELEQRASAGEDARTQNALQQLEAMRQEHRRALDAAKEEASRAVEATRLDRIRSLEGAKLEAARALDEARFDASRTLEAARAEHARALEQVRAEQAQSADAGDADSARELESARSECARLMARLSEAERRCQDLQAKYSNVDQRVHEAQTALSEAQAQAQMKGDFLATISHEIRTPMNGVMGMTHLLLETELDNEQRNLVEVIRNSSQTLIHLINDTLDFSKLEAGRLEIERLDFDLRVTVDEVSALLAPMANAKALVFDCQVSHEVPSRLKGDPGRIRQVLFNLGGNAIKFTQEGRVTVRVDRVSEDNARVTLKFSVTDTGGADSRAELAQVYQSAAPPDASITRQYGGSGLGLAISRSLVALMGGEVGVETEGQDSSYWFRMALDKQAGPAFSAAPKNVQLRGMRVIVVDPAKNIRQSLKEMLSAWGCETDEAESADEALVCMRAAASKGRPHQVALIEMQLPGTNGEQLGGAIRSDAALERAITMLMTSVGRKGDAQRAQSMGFSAYLLKPIEWGELYDGLIEVIHAQQSQSPGGAPALVTRHSLAEARRGRMRILLVEDNAVDQLVANWALQRLGYTIDVANSGSEALSRSETQRYDLILMDVQMPDMDGFKTTTAIRTRERGGMRTPIVAMTGNAQPSELERVRAAGMDDCLTKPIDIGQLCSTAERWTRAQSSNAASGDRSPVRADAITLKAPDLEKKLELMARGDDPVRGSKRAPGAKGDGPPAKLEKSGIGFKPGVIESEGPEAPEVPIDNARLEGSSMGMAALRDTLLNTFLADVPPRLDRLAAAMVEHEAHRIEFEAHSLMGMCATVGAVGCERVFAQIERLAAEDRITECTRLLPAAKAEVERTEAYISRLERILNRAA